MIKTIRIKTKIQNIILGIAVLITCAAVAISAYTDFSSNKSNIINQKTKELETDVVQVQDSLSRYFNSTLASLGELYYDQNIKQAIKTRNTRLYNVYKRKAISSLRDFSLLKGFENVVLYDSDFKLIASLTRTIPLNKNHINDIAKRIENYKDKQVIFHRFGNTDSIVFILKIEYSAGNSAYVLSVKNLKDYSQGLADYETDSAEFYAFTRSLSYKNTLIKLKGPQSYSHFNLQADTMIKYNRYFARSYNAMGQETISQLKDLDGFQNVFILGLIKPGYIEKTALEKKEELVDLYGRKVMWLGVLLLFYLAILGSRVNIQDQFIKIKLLIMRMLNKDLAENDAKVLSKQAKKDAYSYIDQEASLSHSVLKIYNSLRKMTPEDIKNLSIKNSLSKENIRLVYQPVVDANSLQPQFCEVFLRLLNYYGEELMPSEFIPVLEHFNMLENLDEMMLEKIIRKIETLQAKDPMAKISLNISNGAFNSYKFLDKLKYELNNGNMNTENVMLEIPQVDILDERSNSMFVQHLGEKGVQFTVSIGKLDKALAKKLVDHKIGFIRVSMADFADVLENTEKQAILKEILTNAKKNDLKIIAERIETEMMFKLAKSLEIDLLQGYYIGKPKKYYTHK